MAGDGSVAISCWEQYFKPVKNGIWPYVNSLSRWKGSNPNGNKLLRSHLEQAIHMLLRAASARREASSFADSSNTFEVAIVKHLTLAAALFAIGVTPAFADNERGLYLGAGVGLFNIEIDDLRDVAATSEGFDSDDTVYKVFAGWRFAPFIAVELDYLDLGAPEDRIQPCRLSPEYQCTPINVEAEISGVAPYLIGTLPLGRLELFAKVGYYFYDIEINAESLGSLDDSNEDLVYGAGLGITLFEHLHARLEYEIIDISEVDDANAAWLSGAWRF
jgi:outer membrane immunogenic protein